MKTILITGSSSGIGKATALLFLSKGWKVIGISRTESNIHNINYQEYLLDITSYEQVDKVIELILENNKIDCLYNNAGYGYFAPLENSDFQEIKKQFETNFFAQVFLTKKFVEYFRKQGGGIIAFTSSLSGKISTPFFSFYSSSKWALEGFLESLNFEIQGTNIRIKIIEPGIINTNFFRSDSMSTNFGDGFYKSKFDKFKNSFLNRGFGATEPSEVAKVVWVAIHDDKDKLRYLITTRAFILATMHKFLPISWYQNILTWYLK